LLAIEAADIALNVAVVAPEATVTDAGTVSEALLLASVTMEPPAGAVCVSVTVQVEICPPFRLLGAHVIDERAAGTVTIPPAVVNEGSPEPVASTPTAFDMPIDAVVALVARVSWTLATTPAVIAFVFKPAARHVNKPGAEAHESVFPAAVAAGPAVALIAEI
jgi:hypothetical protein